MGDSFLMRPAPIDDSRPDHASRVGSAAEQSRLTELSRPDITVVIPAFNEERRLPATLRDIVGYFVGRDEVAEIIAVNDGSLDGTERVIDAWSNRHAQIRSIRFATNRGKGAAVRAGVLAATGSQVLFADADGATPIEELARLRAAIADGADIAIGSRAKPGGNVTVAARWYRRLIGRVFHRLVSMVAVTGFADTQCGFKLFRATAAQNLFSCQRVDGFAFDVEILLAAKMGGYRVDEVPVNWAHRTGSGVKLVSAAARMALDLVVIRRNYVRTTPEVSGAYAASSAAASCTLNGEDDLAGSHRGSRSGRGHFPYLLLTVLAARLASLGLIPLADTTEARYGEIARLMVQTGDWITPQIASGVPFWGKPPLSTWLSAASMAAFGVNEIAARLPSLVLGVVVLWLTHRLARTRYSPRGAWISLVVLGTMPLFFVSIGAVMTDPALLLGTTLSMVAFWISVTAERRAMVWGYLFFVGVAVGLLAKGPVALVMTGVPVAVWTMRYGSWARVWRRLPCLSGLLMTVVLTVPWYAAAEIKTPGFLEYFLVGEHWNRFVIAGWQGDLYGSAHARPWGTIWVYWLLATAPWVIAAFARLGISAIRGRVRARLCPRTAWHGYLGIWTLTPLVFFTFASNILWTYVLTGLPALSLLVAGILLRADAGPDPVRQRSGAGAPLDRTVSVLALGMTVLVVTALVFAVAGLVPSEISQRALIAEYRLQRGSPRECLTYIGGTPPSAAFYSRGRELLLPSTEALTGLPRDELRDFFAVRDLRDVPAVFLDRVDEVGTFGRYHLLRER